MCNVQIRPVHCHSECIGLYTELIGWHCLGAESINIGVGFVAIAK